MNHNYILYNITNSNTLQKYNIVCGIISYNLSRSFPIKLYKYFILKMDSHRFGTQKKLFT